MQAGIFGPRPSVNIPGSAEIVDFMVSKLVAARRHVNIVVALGFNLDVIKKVKKIGGAFSLHGWDTIPRMTRNWYHEEDKQAIFQAALSSRENFLPTTRAIKSCYQVFCSVCDVVYIVNPGEMDASMIDVMKMAKKVVIFKSREDVFNHSDW
jgi:hypothetical protein